jgi:hypothetical protein
MVRAFTEPEELTLPDGTVYKNPYADLHTLTAVKCCAPQAFAGIPESKWVPLSKDNGSRQKGKITNFGILYLQTAESLSLLNHVKLEETELWVKGHKTTYAGYHHWAEEYGGIAASRGFAVSPVSQAIRWVDEENSKGGGESPARAAVNYAIQGESAQITKECLIRLYEILSPDIKILNTVHDEINLEAPGKSWLSLEKSKFEGDLLVGPVFEYDQQALDTAEQVKAIMVNTETEFFAAAGSPILGRAEYAIAPYWKH